MKKHPDGRPRLFRPTRPDYFPRAEIVAVHDQVNNVVLFNTAYSGDATLERRALFMDDPVLELPENYLQK